MFAVACGLCCERTSSKKHGHGPKTVVRFAKARTAALGSDDSMSDRAHSADEKGSFVQNLLPEGLNGSTISSSFTKNGNTISDTFTRRENEEEEMRGKVRELQAAAQRLEGPVQKYPRSGKGLFKKMQDRYIAVCRGESEGGCQGDANTEMTAWKSGQLAYWENERSWKQNAVPKGSVCLMKIAKVWVSKDDNRGRSVVVKHKDKDQMNELVLCFPTKRDADEWSYALWDFISKLRGHEQDQYNHGGSAMF